MIRGLKFTENSGLFTRYERNMQNPGKTRGVH